MADSISYVNMADVMLSGTVERTSKLTIQPSQSKTEQVGDSVKASCSPPSRVVFDAKTFYSTPGLEWDTDEVVKVGKQKDHAGLADCQTGPDCYVCQRQLNIEEIGGICTRCISIA
jgi:hypothetical protein